ncbi:cytochrome c [Planctomycetota bacterium]|nr:cytochrome c [Planctomycetota bacterium]
MPFGPTIVEGLLQGAVVVCQAAVVWCLAAGAVGGESGLGEGGLGGTYARVVKPFLATHCVSCHGPEQQKGDKRFDGGPPDLTDPKQAATWTSAQRMMASGEMPPEGKPSPSADELRDVFAYLQAESERAATITRGGIGRRSLRRLTAREYVNSVQDLLGLSFPAFSDDLVDRLPIDQVVDGFANDSDAQSTQPLLLQRSLELVERMLDVAIPSEAVTPFRFVTDLPTQLAALREPWDALPESERAKRKKPDMSKWVVNSDDKSEKPAQGMLKSHPKGIPEQQITKEGVYLSPNPNIRDMPLDCLEMIFPLLPEHGVLRLRVVAGAKLVPGDSTPVLRFGFVVTSLYSFQPLAQVTITAPAEAPTEQIIDIPLDLVDTVWSQLRAQKSLHVRFDNSADLLVPPPRLAKDAAKNPPVPRSQLLIRSISVEVAKATTWPESTDRIVVPTAGPEESAQARSGLSRFLFRAFRRPVTTAEVESYLAVYGAERKRGASTTTALKSALAAILISPQMLFLAEPKQAARTRLTPFELASRLSYLLCNTTPDDELLRLAADGSLATPAVLRQQVARLVTDPRALSFCTDFARQWLNLAEVMHLKAAIVKPGSTSSGGQAIEFFEHQLKRDFIAEAPHLLRELLTNNLPVEHLVASDFVVINERLAAYYGIDGVVGPHFRRVAAPPERMGGVLTQAGSIAAASHGHMRSEIKRGVFLIERILGIDIPTPPGNAKPLDVQALENDKLRKLTPRQHLQQHVSISTCGVCHARIDPLGFVWDNYDLYGRPIPTTTKDGKPIAGSTGGRLPDKTDFSDFAEFRRLLADPSAAQRRFAEPFTRRLLSYALGRGLDHGDEAHLAAIAKAAAQEGNGLRALVTAIVLSEPFTSK